MMMEIAFGVYKMKWVKKYSKEFERDALRKLISKVNWSYFKPSIKANLIGIAQELNKNGIEVSVYDHQDEPNGFGFDSLTLQFNTKFTGNMIKKVEKDKTTFNYHKQIGGRLVITYSAVGHVHIFVDPPTSEDSVAENSDLILYHTYDAQNITDRRIKRCIKILMRYQRFTGVLYRNSLLDRWVVRWYKTKTYLIRYLNPQEKFVRYSALYIPLISMIVATVAAIASLIAVYLTYLSLTH
ncbi:TPA: hypothetical protein ACYFBF_003336 [Klebsiella pneumoniae]|uniref:hypothetical protein n=1 Tax=Klebsiella pneumoniae TaxID=573 RepID=UPI0010F74F97|nr:hypothetical protein [Klebsiella pneumoniae]AWA69280.2 hypothetical protein B7D49_19765 [Klebsiella pneumoniae]EKX6962552.1 hypothetical protein [Klebsiella pneumoniae]MCB3011227.1 hypothetical protein [Klebsiella pneumoniae]MCB3212105.1 hypothetical protein [Klebsiella pneumoniae]MCB3223809.1 hypothetical protein [Klebsiella pneumoniae]